MIAAVAARVEQPAKDAEAAAQIAVLVLKSWREAEDHVVPGAAARLSRSTILRLIALGFLRPVAKGPAGQIRIAADDLDVAWRALEEARALARDRFGCRRRGGLSDRLARTAYASAHPTSRPARRARDDAQRRQLDLFEGSGR